jgi:adenosylcobyric acid synthase
MGFATAADVPVLLLGDIDRGGVIASLVGTHAVLAPEDRARIKGFVVNKFRGDLGLFASGTRIIEERTAWPARCLPWFAGARALPAEDVLGLADGVPRRNAKLVIAVPVLPRIANFDDLDPLRLEPEVSVVLIQPASRSPGTRRSSSCPGRNPPSPISPFFVPKAGTSTSPPTPPRRKSLGLCGGYQMLAGRSPIRMASKDRPAPSPAWACSPSIRCSTRQDDRAGRRNASRSGTPVSATNPSWPHRRPDCTRPLLDLAGRADGAISPDGLVSGTYVHGLFADDAFRRAFLDAVGAAPSAFRYEASVESALDELAAMIERHTSIDRLLDIARNRPHGAPSREMR